MKLTADTLLQRLSKPIAPVIWIHGDEPLLCIEAADAVRASARAQGFVEREVIQVERGFKGVQLTQTAGAVSLFAEKKLIELRLNNGKPNADLGQAIVQAIEHMGDDTRLLITSARLEKQVTITAWFNQMDAHAWVLALYPLERQQLPGWIADRLLKQGQTADRELIAWLAEKVEGNLMAADQEIRKLSLLCAKGKLDSATVQAAVMNVARYSAFDVVNAMLAGDLARCLRALDGLKAEGEAPPLLVWAFADAVRTLLRLVTARQNGQNPSSLFRELRIFGPREQIFQQATQRLDTRVLQQALMRTALADKLSKGIERTVPHQNPLAQDCWMMLADIARLMCIRTAR